KCYNKLKNQFQSLQNTKNELAKSQPYKVQRLLLDEEKKICVSEKIADTLRKDICNTEYISHCIRRWSKDFLEQGTLSRH
ncbi:23107_t:CDS:2, partial [Gigaspora margarita]